MFYCSNILTDIANRVTSVVIGVVYCSNCTTIVAGGVTGVVVGVTDRRHSFMLANIAYNVTVR